jgi:hypothetical protein
MAKPGVVLRRPVGTDKPFVEHAALPRDFAKIVEGSQVKKVKREMPAAPLDEKQAREAAAQYERE